jgi:heat shock protein HslJ
MKLEQIILLFGFLMNVYTQTVAWQGVSDLGGRGVGITTGSQTIGPGYSSSSSSSSISSGPGSSSSSSTPKTTLTVYSSSPVNIRTNTPSSTTTQSSRNTASQSIIGNYSVRNINGVPVNFEVNIDESNIGFKYCNTKGMSYSISGSSIKVSPGFSTKMLCSNLSPS